MASGNKSRPPIVDPYSLDYAPTGRAVCKVCDRAIGGNTLRFGRKVWSPWHDGFDIKYSHFSCGVKKVECITELKGWQSLRWKDVLRVAKFFGQTIDEDNDKVKYYKKISDLIWKLQEELMQLNLKTLRLILDENNRYYVEKKLKIHNAAYIIADGLILGKLPPCPICGCSALIQQGPEYRCTGWVSGATKCSFKHLLFYLHSPDILENDEKLVEDEVLNRTEGFLIPETVRRMPFFVKWTIPSNAPAIKFQTNMNNNSKNTKISNKYDSETEDENDIPQNNEALGIKCTVVGQTIPPWKDLSLVVQKHGATVCRDVDPETTFLFVGEDINAAKSTKRYEDAVSMGVPILHYSYIIHLISRKISKVSIEGKNQTNICWKDGDSNIIRPKGIILRQRKYAQFYRINGKLWKRLPKVKDLLNNTKYSKKNKKNIEKRPSIIPGSALLQVDEEIAKRRKNSIIYINQIGDAFNCNLHLTDIGTGINKFYSLQLLETPKGTKSSKYAVFRKWGRVGSTNSLTNDSRVDDYGTDIQAAEEYFRKKFYELTRIDWDERFDASQQPGGYAYVEVHGYDHDGEAINSTINNDEEPSHENVNHQPKRKKIEENITKNVPKIEKIKMESSTLDERLQDLINLIFDKQMMLDELKKQNVNLEKMPLQTISTRQLNSGYLILKEIQTLISTEQVKNENANLLKVKQHKLLDATTRFYTAVPHTFKHQEVPPIIDDASKLRAKVDMMEQLLDISVANSLLDDVEREKASSSRNIMDVEFEKLNVMMEPIDSGTEEWDLIYSMMKNTHAPTHNTYTLKLKHLFRCHKDPKSNSQINPSMAQSIKIENKNIIENENVCLLWHGSRLTNWVGILSKGLRIAPAAAPSTGFMFGKGIYFADVVSKSANYCMALPSNPFGVLVLCEVDLGKQKLLLEADEKITKCPNYDSTWGVGRAQPASKENKFISSIIDGKIKVKAPTGKLEPNGDNIKLSKQYPDNKDKDPVLLYNEYVVYDTDRIKIRYLLFVEFVFETFFFDD